MMVIDLMHEAKNLNSSISNVANCEKAKMIKKKLLRIGGIMTVVGAIGILFCIACIALSALVDINSQNSSIPVMLIAGLICFLPAIVVFGFGLTILNSGFKINIIDHVSELVEEQGAN